MTAAAGRHNIYIDTTSKKRSAQSNINLKYKAVLAFVKVYDWFSCQVSHETAQYYKS